MKEKIIQRGRDAQWRVELRSRLNARQRGEIERAQMPELEPDERLRNPRSEVNRGLTAEQVASEASRCLDCPNPGCVTGCPVSIDIPGFIKELERGDIDSAAAVLKHTSALPAVCGRVCPQEKQCESRCIYNKMNKKPVAIGYLERYAADHGNAVAASAAEPNGIKVAVVGSGPAGLSFAGAMAARGFDVTVYEALHEIGGVLKYGIPEFRLPNEIVDREIDQLRANGVRFERDVIVGKTISVDDLRKDGFRGIFVGSGAGLPRFMDIPGENLNGVMSCNEYLTRINLMGAGREGFDTPVMRGRRVAVIGDEHGHVSAMRLQRMELGEPDASGRRSPVPVEGDIVELPVDLVIVSVGVSPNPIVPSSIKGLDVSRRGTIVVDDELMQSSISDIYAGGDIVRGGATVILAMGDGRRAALSMAEALLSKNK